MTRIYLVQSATDLDDSNGYSSGLLEGGHRMLLVAFTDYMGKGSSIFKDKRPKVEGQAQARRRVGGMGKRAKK